MKPAVLWMVLALASFPLAAQPGNRGEESFIASARQATARYQDRSVAIAEGYRLIGSDFPGMGEHWIRIGLLFDGIFDPAQPEILTYAMVSGKPQLLGVAYVIPLLPGESAPDWPVGREKWHDHFRSLEDETSMPQHHAPGHTGNVSRMAMLHAWIWLENPAGMFAADNWAIPYVRLGIQPIENGTEPAAKALALASGGAGYFAASIHAAIPLKPTESARVDAAFTRSRIAVETLLHGRSTGTLATSEVDGLSAIWTGLWKEIDSAVGSRARVSLQHLPVR